MAEAQIVRLEDVAFIQQGKHVDHLGMGEAGHPMYGANGVIGSWITGTYDFDVVGLGCRGSVGTVYEIPAGAWLGNNVMGVWPKDEGTLTRGFLRLALETADFRSSGVISGQVQEQITRKSLGPLEINLPLITVQRRIVDLVSLLDRHVSVLNAEHEQAQKQYQVLLSDILNEEMHKYGTRPLLAGVELQNGYPFKPGELGSSGTRVLRIKQLQDESAPWDRSVIDLPARFLVRDRDLVFSWSGTLAVQRWARGTVFLNQHLFRVDVHGAEIDSFWFEHCLRWLLPWMNERTHGTTMKHITKRKLAEAVVPNAPVEVQRDTGSLLSAAKQLVERVQDERDAVAAVRDTVLEGVLSETVTVPASYDSLLERV